MKNIILIITMLFITGCGVTDSIMEDVVKTSIYVWQDQTYIPNGYSFVTPNTLTILGNSIASCPGWTNENRGMAASSIDKDYSHLLSGLMIVSTDNLTVENHWDIEANYWDYDFTSLPEADLVIIQLGDNLVNVSGYSPYLSEMVLRFKNNGKQVILISTILPGGGAQQDKNDQIISSAKENGVPYIDVRGVCANYQNVPGSGVETQHPNDEGMRLIAERIYSLIK